MSEKEGIVFEKIALVIVGPFSVALGWFLNEWSSIASTHREDLRIKKKVLCNLLNFWHIIKRDNPDLMIDIIFGKILQKLPEDISKEGFLSILKPKIQSFAKASMHQMDSQETPAVTEKLAESIDLLSGVDPFLAYRLSGKQTILDFVKAYKNRYEKFMSALMIELDEESTSAFEELKKKLEPHITKELINVIEDDVRGVAASIGRRTFRRIDRKLREQSKFIAKEMQKKIDELFVSFGINGVMPDAFDMD